MRKIVKFLPHSWEAKVPAILEAKDMKKITLDELIGNLQTYELRRNFQQKEEIKKDGGIALKVMEEDSSNLNVEEMAMITRNSRSFSRRPRRTQRGKTSANSRTVTGTSSQDVSNVVSLTTL